MYLTRRRIEKRDSYKERGFHVTADNNQAVTRSCILLICVEPHQLDQLLEEIRETVDPAEQIVISVVSGAEVAEIKKQLPAGTPVVRATPNTPVSIRESLVCFCSDEEGRAAAEIATRIFDTVGHTQVVHEEQMSSDTALCACGMAFFLRAIRAVSQGGIEIVFSSQEALKMATQT